MTAKIGAMFHKQLFHKLKYKHNLNTFALQGQFEKDHATLKIALTHDWPKISWNSSGQAILLRPGAA